MLQTARRSTIAVCGGGGRVDEALTRSAEILGEGIVAAGCVLLCGGLGGVMEAAARGGDRARRAGAQGIVVGLLPGDDAGAANPHCEIALPTGIGALRNGLIARSADAVVLVGGGSGTLSEAALAWQFGKPLVALADSGGWAAELAGRPIDQRRSDCVAAAENAAKAVELALRAVGRARGAD